MNTPIIYRGIGPADTLWIDEVPASITKDAHAPVIHYYEPGATDDPDLFRMVDRNGDWTHYWVKSKNLYLPAANYIIDKGYPKGDRLLAYMRNNTAEEQELKLSRAGEQGSRVHYAIRDIISGLRVTVDTRYENSLTGEHQRLTAREWDMLRSWLQFAQDYQIKLYKQEFSLWNPKHGYAGTGDFLGQITLAERKKVCDLVHGRERDVVLPVGTELFIYLDWKTSAGLYEGYPLQFTAYKDCLRGTAKPRYVAALRLGTDHKNGPGRKCGYELCIYGTATQKTAMTEFLAAKAIVENRYGPFHLPEETIPSEILIDLPKVERKPTHKEKPKHAKPTIRPADAGADSGNAELPRQVPSAVRRTRRPAPKPRPVPRADKPGTKRDVAK